MINAIANEKKIKGRGAQFNPANKFLKQHIGQEHIEGLDEELETGRRTQFFTEHPKTILNEVKSPDVGMIWSLNPYQGCEHGCVYCYARNSHQYWGYSAGLDFESRIIVKPTAPALLEKVFLSKTWRPQPISLSGNTDCYQPIEKKMQITRSTLQVCAKYRNPVGIITKNQLVERDLDILKDLASENLVRVIFSITGTDEKIRLQTEPRTATYKQRLVTMGQLSKAGIPVGVMVAPIIPGLTDHMIPDVLRLAAENGATFAGMTMVRLNGAVAEIFTDWVLKTYPDKAQKILNGIRAVHEGNLNDSRWGKRMKGDGVIADAIHQLYRISKEKYFPLRDTFQFNVNAFCKAGQLQLPFNY